MIIPDADIPEGFTGNKTFIVLKIEHPQHGVTIAELIGGEAMKNPEAAAKEVGRTHGAQGSILVVIRGISDRAVELLNNRIPDVYARHRTLERRGFMELLTSSQQ